MLGNSNYTDPEKNGLLSYTFMTKVSCINQKLICNWLLLDNSVKQITEKTQRIVVTSNTKFSAKLNKTLILISSFSVPKYYSINYYVETL